MASGAITVGRRVDRQDGTMWEPGEYGLGSDGYFYGCPPGTDLLGGFHKHQIVEHEDGTISVSPSILIRSPYRSAERHGYLERGVWREV